MKVLDMKEEELLLVHSEYNEIIMKGGEWKMG